MKKNISGKYEVSYNEGEFCYEIRSREQNTIASIVELSVPKVIRLLKLDVKLNYREIAEFCNITSNKVFRLAFTSHMGKCIDECVALSEFLVVDPEQNLAKFYRHDHKPQATDRPHVPVSITNTESPIKLFTFIPAKIATRVNIHDPLNRMLNLAIKATNGYVLGVRDVTLCEPDTTYYVTGAAHALNDLIHRMHFVGAKAGAGSVTITTDDNEGKDNSVATTVINFTLEASETVSIPSVNVPKNLAIKLGEDTKIDPAITVNDDDGKIMALNIYPYNCDVYGWKSLSGFISTNDVRRSTGRPEIINEDIEELHVRALKENAQLGIELLCGKTVIREYLVFNVSSDSSGDDDSDSSVVAVPDMTGNNLTGNLNAKVNLGVALNNNGYKDDINLTVAPTNCTVEIDGATVASGSTKKLTGKLAAINGKLAAAKVNLTTASGSIKLDWNGKSKTITTTGNAAKVPTLTVNNIQGATGAKVGLGASFSTDNVAPNQQVTIAPTGCTFEGFSEGTGTVTLKGTVTEINKKMAAAKVVIGSGPGKIDFTWNGGSSTKSITVSVTPGVPV